MKKIIIILFIGSVCAFLLIAWLFPIKHSVELEALETYADGKVVLLCRGDQITGPLWEVIDFYGVDSTPKHIDTTGSDFINDAKGKVYNYLLNKFIFVGEFSDENPELFIVSRWEAVGKITRFHELIPYPSHYFNFWEVKRN